MSSNLRKKTRFVRTCHRCGCFFKTNFKTSRFCDNCIIPKASIAERTRKIRNLLDNGVVVENERRKLKEIARRLK